MNDVERWLKDLPLADPSPECDRRIERLFNEEKCRPPRFWRRPVALWQCLAACALCIIVGCLAARLFAPGPPAPTHITENFYVVPGPGGTLQGVFDPTQPRNASPWSEFRPIAVEVRELAGDKDKI